MRVALVLTVALIALAAPLAGASSPYFATGTFAAGAPRADPTDACLDETKMGLVSSCAAVPADAANLSYSLHATGLGTVVANLSACFYTAALALIRCDASGPPAVPTPPAAPAPPLGANSVPPIPKLDATVVGSIPYAAARVSVSADAGITVMWTLRTN